MSAHGRHYLILENSLIMVEITTTRGDLINRLSVPFESRFDSFIVDNRPCSSSIHLVEGTQWVSRRAGAFLCPSNLEKYEFDDQTW